MDEGNYDRPIRPCGADVDVRCCHVDDIADYHLEVDRGAIVDESNCCHSECLCGYRTYLLASSEVDVKCDLMDLVVFVGRFMPLMFRNRWGYLDDRHEDR